MIIIEQKPKKYLKRMLEAYFPSYLTVSIITLIYGGFFSLIMSSTFLILFNNEFDLAQWISFIIMLLFSLYLSIILLFKISKIYITKIKLDETANLLKIDYLKYNKKKHITVGLQELTYNIFYCDTCTIVIDRIIFYQGKKKILTQYETSWHPDELLKLAEKLKNVGIKKPFGYNL